MGCGYYRVRGRNIKAADCLVESNVYQCMHVLLANAFSILYGIAPATGSSAGTIKMSMMGAVLVAILLSIGLLL